MKKIIFCLLIGSSIAPAANSATIPTLFTCEESHGEALVQVAVFKDQESHLQGVVVSHKTNGPWNSNILLQTEVHEISRGNVTVYNESKGSFYLRFDRDSVYAETIVRDQKQSFLGLKCLFNADIAL